MLQINDRAPDFIRYLHIESVALFRRRREESLEAIAATGAG